MNFSAKTDVGMVREINQDYIDFQLFEKDNAAWIVVCDGMGGMAAGNVASEMAVKSIRNSLENNLNLNAKPENIASLLVSSIKSANSVVYSAAKQNPDFAGMGTTVVLVVVYKNNLICAHAGDSRAYIFKSNCLTQITTDHSVVQSLVQNGQLTEDEAKNHPNKNIITRAVGAHDDIDVDTNILSFNKDDVLLLCSDGLTNCLESAQIIDLLNKNKVENVAEKLVDLANKNGGVDNITVAVYKGSTL